METNKPKYPSWSKGETKKRQQKRRDTLKEVAQGLGFDSWYKLETAVINGEVVLSRKKPE